MKKNKIAKINLGKKFWAFFGVCGVLVPTTILLSSCSTSNLIAQVESKVTTIQISSITHTKKNMRMRNWVTMFNSYSVDEQMKEIGNYANLSSAAVKKMVARESGVTNQAFVVLTIDLADGYFFENNSSSREFQLTNFPPEVPVGNYRTKIDYSTQNAFISAFNATVGVQAKIDLLNPNIDSLNISHMLSDRTVASITVERLGETQNQVVKTNITLRDFVYVEGNADTVRILETVIKINN